jgi:transcriptional regulator with XRE-family HTH domain
MKRLGFALALLRFHYGLNIRDAAKMIGVSSATLSRIENGKGCEAANFMKVLNWLAGEGKGPTGARR